MSQDYGEMKEELINFCKAVNGKFKENHKGTSEFSCSFSSDKGKKVELLLDSNRNIWAKEEGKENKGIKASDSDFWGGKTDKFFTALDEYTERTLQVSKRQGIWVNK